MKNALTIYRSSAGSGKTYALMREYIALVLENPERFRKIMAITFTNKAAAEMKSRILEGLGNLSEGKDEGLLKQIQEQTGLSTELIQARAELVLQMILHDYGHFGVGTIDSFFQHIVRSFARELKQVVNYEVEMDSSAVLNEVTEKLLDLAGKEDLVTDWLTEFMLSKIEEGRSWRIKGDLAEFGNQLLNENGPEMEHAAADSEILIEKTRKLQSALTQVMAKFENRMHSIGEQGIAAIHGCGLSVNDLRRYTANHFEKIQKDRRVFEPTATVRKVANGELAWFTGNSPRKELIEQLGADILDSLLDECISLYDNHYRDYLTAKAVYSRIFETGLLQEMYQLLGKYREEHQVLLISDFNRLLNKITEGSDASFIFEKAGSRYQYFLLDEFQDTSVTQWTNLEDLLLNALSEGGQVLLVGDVKQSIYRWRGGDMELLQSKASVDLERLVQDVVNVGLQDNWRSRKEIVEFNNNFFEKAHQLLMQDETLANNPAFRHLFNELKQNPKKKTHFEGVVSLDFHEANSRGEEEEKYKYIALEASVSQIDRCLELGYKPGDIAILVRTRTQGSYVADHLSMHYGNKYKLVSSDSLLMSNSHRVKLVINALRWLLKPDDKLIGVELLHDYLIEHQREIKSLNGLFSRAEGELNEFIEKAIGKEFPASRADLMAMPLYDAVEQIIFLLQLNKEPDSYLQRLQDIILDKQSREALSISAFIDWWNDKGVSTTVPSGASEDAIQLMTIHKSKGLQFPVVIIPFADWEMAPSSKQSLWLDLDEEPINTSMSVMVPYNEDLRADSIFSEDMNLEYVHSFIDNLNMTYVAFTRAAERLHIHSPFPPKSSKIQNGKIPELMWNTMHYLEYSDGEVDSYVIGDSDANAERTAKEGKADDMLIHTADSVRSVPWQRRLEIKKQLKWGIKSLSESHADAQKYGIWLHDALERMSSAKDLEQVLASMINDGLLPHASLAEVRAHLQEVITDPSTEFLFDDSWAIMNEREIVTPAGYSYRPDRVMINGKQAIVVDYKSGQKSNKHNEQVKRYMKLLREMGYEDISGYLLYFDPVELIQV